jgi:hypothetical protein
MMARPDKVPDPATIQDGVDLERYAGCFTGIQERADSEALVKPEATLGAKVFSTEEPWTAMSL